MSTLVHAGPVSGTPATSRVVLAACLPLVALALQWIFWSAIQPYVWFLFYPAVFLSSWVGGLRGGLAATLLSTLLVWYVFIPPPFSFALERPISALSMALFTAMGVAFSLFISACTRPPDGRRRRWSPFARSRRRSRAST